jgi:hypothetical protein
MISRQDRPATHCQLPIANRNPTTFRWHGPIPRRPAEHAPNNAVAAGRAACEGHDGELPACRRTASNAVCRKVEPVTTEQHPQFDVHHRPATPSQPGRCTRHSDIDQLITGELATARKPQIPFGWIPSFHPAEQIWSRLLRYPNDELATFCESLVVMHVSYYGAAVRVR